MIINLNNIDLYYITIGIFLISLIVQMQLQSKVKKYSKQKLSSGKTGAEVDHVLQKSDMWVLVFLRSVQSWPIFPLLITSRISEEFSRNPFRKYTGVPINRCVLL